MKIKIILLVLLSYSLCYTQITRYKTSGANADIDLSNYVTKQNLDSVKANRAYVNHLHLEYLKIADTLNKWSSKLHTHTQTDISYLKDSLQQIRSLVNLKLNFADTTNKWQPKGNYLQAKDLDNYVDNTTLTNTLKSYVTSINLNAILQNYLQESDLTNYVKSTDLGIYQQKINNGTTGQVWKMLDNNTQGWGNDLIGEGTPDLSSFATKAELTNYVQNNTLTNYVQSSTLNNYSLKTDLNNYVQNSTLTNYVQSSMLTDYITNTQLTNKNYLTAELDPIFSAHVSKNITNTDITNWTTAYNWGNHSTQGYLKSADLSNYVTNSSLTTTLNNYTLVTDLDTVKANRAYKNHTHLQTDILNLKDTIQQVRTLVNTQAKNLDDLQTTINSIPTNTGGGTADWELNSFTTINTTNNTITVTADSKYKKGLPVKFKIGSEIRYALITNIAGGVLTLSGASLTSAVTEFYLGKPEKVLKHDFGFYEYWSAYPYTSGTYFDGLIDMHLGANYTWGNSDAYLVQIGAICKVMDTPTATTLQLYKNTTSTMINSTALSLETTVKWVYTNNTHINTTNYKIVYGDKIDIRVNRPIATALSRNLTMTLWFVLE